MEYYLQKQFFENKHNMKYIIENSYYIKYLNRNPNYYKEFIRNMKELYKERPTDKLNNIVNTIDIVSSVIDTLK